MQLFETVSIEIGKLTKILQSRDLGVFKNTKNLHRTPRMQHQRPVRSKNAPQIEVCHSPYRNRPEHKTETEMYCIFHIYRNFTHIL